MLTRPELTTTVTRILRDETETTEEITEHTPLGGEGLGLTSLGLIRVLIRIETEFDVPLDDEAVMTTDLRTVGDLVDIASRPANVPS